MLERGRRRVAREEADVVAGGVGAVLEHAQSARACDAMEHEMNGAREQNRRVDE